MEPVINTIICSDKKTWTELEVKIFLLYGIRLYNMHREYNDWILMKLKHMNKLVTQAQDLVQRELHFIQSFPLLGLLKEDAEELLKEADSLVAGQDQLGQMEGECTLIEETLLERQIQQETFGGFTASQVCCVFLFL